MAVLSYYSSLYIPAIINKWRIHFISLYCFFLPNSLINTEEKKNPGVFQLLEPPFGTDNMSTWERDDSKSNGKEKVNREMPK